MYKITNVQVNIYPSGAPLTTFDSTQQRRYTQFCQHAIGDRVVLFWNKLPAVKSFRAEVGASWPSLVPEIPI